MDWRLSSHSIITRGQALVRITLAEALASGDLERFIRQEEAEGRVADRADFERRLGALIKAPQPQDRTSRSHARGGWRDLEQALGAGIDTPLMQLVKLRAGRAARGAINLRSAEANPHNMFQTGSFVRESNKEVPD